MEVSLHLGGGRPVCKLIKSRKMVRGEADSVREWHKEGRTFEPAGTRKVFFSVFPGVYAHWKCGSREKEVIFPFWPGLENLSAERA